MELVYLVWAILTGVALSVQASVNTSLSLQLRSVLVSSIVNFFVAIFFLLIIITLIEPSIFLNIKSILNSKLELWKLTGGILGVLGVTSIIFVTPKLGVGTVVTLYLFGQILMSLIIGNFGWFGMPIIEISINKVIGVIITLIGVFLTQKKDN